MPPACGHCLTPPCFIPERACPLPVGTARSHPALYWRGHAPCLWALPDTTLLYTREGMLPACGHQNKIPLVFCNLLQMSEIVYQYPCWFWLSPPQKHTLISSATGSGYRPVDIMNYCWTTSNTLSDMSSILNIKYDVFP